MRIRHLREPDYRRMRWKNGGGWTTELASKPRNDSGKGFDWRISIAEIESDGAFSTFTQCDRFIALLDGNGMRLDFDEAPTALLDQRLQFVPFSGDWKTFGSLIGGPVRDFNVIVRRDVLLAEVSHHPLAGSMPLLAEPGVTWFVYLISGRATIANAAEPIIAGESLLLEPDASHPAVVLNGGGGCIVVKFKPLS